MAHAMEVFIRLHDVRFVFTRLEKEHLAATKFVDTFFDSGINKAVSPLHYSSRLFRLHTAHIAAELMDLEDRNEFWQAYTQGNCEKFYNVLERFGQRVKTYVEDARTREVLTEAVTWAQQYPELLLSATATELDAPNAVAIGLLIQALHEKVGEVGQRLTRFIHDESNQFALEIKATFVFLRGFKAPPRNPSALISDWTETDTLDCPIEMASSKSTPGLQVVDVVLWLVKRYVDHGFEGFSACERLARLVLNRSPVSSFTRDGLQDEVVRLWMAIMKVPLPESAVQRGAQIVASLEQARKKRMSEPVAETEPPTSPDPKKYTRKMKKIVRDLASKAEKPFKR